MHMNQSTFIILGQGWIYKVTYIIMLILKTNI
jgi:hypothetical protein